MFFYYAHGLNISSEIPFPELIKKKSTTDFDVNIRIGQTDLLQEHDFKECYLNSMIKVWFSTNQTKLFWEDKEVCSIINSKEIVINPLTNLEENLIRLIILGYSIALILHQKRRLVLHANAVEVNGGAVAFLGHSGQGKSTISLALHRKGYNLLSDDILSVEVDKYNYPLIFPSFPRIKLWPEVIENINKNPESFPPLHFNTNKRSYNLTDAFPLISMPLKAIYIIKNGQVIDIKEVNPKKAFIEIIKSSYCYPTFDFIDISENFNQCAKVVNDVPVKILKFKHSFDDLPTTVEIIETDLL